MDARPTEQQWHDALAVGFAPNGVGSMIFLAPPTIWGVRITTGIQYPPGPADLHDFRYWVGGNDRDRYQGDVEFWTGMLDLIRAKPWWYTAFKPFAEHRAGTYFQLVRQFGQWFYSWKLDPS